MTHLAQGFGFDLTDALTGHLELAADFLEGAAVAVLEAEALLEHFALAFGEGVEHVLDLVLEHRKAGFLHRVVGGLVLNEVTEGSVV